MKRETVIQLYRESSDSWIAEARRGGIVSEDLWQVYQSSMLRGVSRFMDAGAVIAKKHPDVDEKDFEDLLAAGVQVWTAIGLMLELMPEPDTTTVLATFGGEANGGKLN